MREISAKRVFKIFLPVFFTLLSSCSHLFFYPEKSIPFTPSLFKHQFTDVTIPIGQEGQLTGWVIEPKSKAIGTVLHFHGNAQNMAYHLPGVIWLVEKGYRLLTFDYRGYGRSSHSPSLERITQDSARALEVAIKGFGDQSLYLFSQSLGGISAMRALSKLSQQKKIKGVIIEASFCSYRKMAQSKIKQKWWLTPLLPLQFTISQEFDSCSELQSIQVPTLVIHSQKDPVVPHSFGQEIFKNLPQDKAFFYSMTGGLHLGHSTNPQYRQNILSFLQFSKSLK